MSGRKESVKERERLQTGKRLLNREQFNFFLILFQKKLKSFNSWNISSASAKPNVESRK